MAWTQLRAFPAEKLHRIRGWEQRGLAYWQKRLRTCGERVAKADSSTQLGRALNDREIALEAVNRLSA